MEHKLLPDPPQFNWAYLFEMNGLKRGSGTGTNWRNFDDGVEVIDRHAQGDKRIVGRGVVALIEYLEI